MTDDMTSDDIMKLANNLLKPIQVKNIKDELKVGGFFDYRGFLDANEELQSAIQDDRLLGVKDKYQEPLSKLHSNQKNYLEKRLGKTITDNMISVDNRGQMIVTDPAGNNIRISVVNKDEVVEIKRSGSDTWEIFK